LRQVAEGVDVSTAIRKIKDLRAGDGGRAGGGPGHAAGMAEALLWEEVRKSKKRALQPAVTAVPWRCAARGARFMRCHVPGNTIPSAACLACMADLRDTSLTHFMRVCGRAGEGVVAGAAVPVRLHGVGDDRAPARAGASYLI